MIIRHGDPHEPPMLKSWGSQLHKHPRIDAYGLEHYKDQMVLKGTGQLMQLIVTVLGVLYMQMDIKYSVGEKRC